MHHSLHTGCQRMCVYCVFSFVGLRCKQCTVWHWARNSACTDAVLANWQYPAVLYLLIGLQPRRRHLIAPSAFRLYFMHSFASCNAVRLVTVRLVTGLGSKSADHGRRVSTGNGFRCVCGCVHVHDAVMDLLSECNGLLAWGRWRRDPRTEHGFLCLGGAEVGARALRVAGNSRRYYRLRTVNLSCCRYASSTLQSTLGSAAVERHCPVG